MLHDWRSLPPVRNLVLSALSTDTPTTLQSLVRIGQVFGVDAATTRVTLGRLVRDGLLRQIDRGQYAIGEGGAALRERVRRWRTVGARTRPWEGSWLIVLVDHLGRADRTRLRLRERALKLSGFARAEEGYWLRPDNLRPTMPEIISEAVSLGLEPNAVAFGSAEALSANAARLHGLWPIDDLVAAYRFWIDELDASMTRLPTMRREEAARESFLLGQAVIRAINLDPLLPAEMIDTDLRCRMVEQMIAYDEIGRRCWSELDLEVRPAA